MLTPKEKKFLNLIYLKLKGKHMETFDLWKLLNDFFRLKNDLAFELAYLYDKNFEQANGDFTNVKNVDRKTYQQYQKSLVDEIVAVMQLTEDYNVDNYETHKYPFSVLVNYNNTTYHVYKNTRDIVSNVADIIVDFIKDDPYPYVVYILNNTLISLGERRRIAIEDTNKYVNEKLSNDNDIIKNGDIKEEYDKLEKGKNEINDILGQLINTTELMDDYLKLHRLGKEEENQEEYIKLKNQISGYKKYLNSIQEEIVGGYEIKEDMSVEEITDRVDDILYEIDNQIEDLIENTKNQIRENKFNEILYELGHDPFMYFYENFDMNEEDYINLNFVEIDYEASAKEYAESSDRSFSDLLALDEETTIFVKGKKYYIFW